MPRPAKPLALHIVQGTTRSRVKKREKGSLHLAPGSVGECPAWLPPEGREEWARLVADPDYSRCLAPSHRGTLIDYCNLYGRMVRHERRQPMWVDGVELQPQTMPTGEVVAPPWESMSASERQTLHSLRMQLGLTPASQSKVKVSDAPKADNPYEGM